MFVVGVTGSLSTGKSTVVQYFAQWGAQIIDADKIVHQLISPAGDCYQRVIQAFGTEILKRGKIDRKLLGKRVFSDAQQLKKLERILHPVVVEEIIKKIQSARLSHKKGVLVVDIPLLFEVGLNKHVDQTIVVKANKRVQILRASQALGINPQEAKRRIEWQMPLSDKVRLADFVINNSQSLQETKEQAKKIWQKILQMIRK